MRETGNKKIKMLFSKRIQRLSQGQEFVGFKLIFIWDLHVNIVYVNIVYLFLISNINIRSMKK